MFGLLCGAVAEYELNGAVWLIDDTVSRELLAVNGVQQVKRLGGKKREVRMPLQSAKLNALGITAEQVSQQLAQTNANVPAMRVQWFDQEQSIRVVDSQLSLADLANLPIALSDYRKVKLAELATICDSHADIYSRTRLNGREVLGFQVFRSKGQAITSANFFIIFSCKTKTLWSISGTTRSEYSAIRFGLPDFNARIIG